MVDGRGGPMRGAAQAALAHLESALRAVAAAEEALCRPTAASLMLAAGTLEREAIPSLKALEAALLPVQPVLEETCRASLTETGAALRMRIARLGRLLDGAARLHAGYALELASRLGYSAEGAALPLSVIRGAGRECNLQA
ncbi:MAG: hypothetical protein KJZ84_12265 [Bryobacteraceae bacterium]|nr:hypothetical protein [Bryobacteraceae bacterium]